MASVKMTVFWDVVSCRVVEVYRRFRGVYCTLNVGKLLSIHTAQQPRKKSSWEQVQFKYCMNSAKTLEKHKYAVYLIYLPIIYHKYHDK
jgi:hypothetical protein